MTKTMTDQVEMRMLGKKIFLILSRQKKIGENNLNERYQGAGGALFLKIPVTHGDEKFLEEAEDFITKELGLTLKIERKHGKGGKKNTLLVQLFGVKEESLEKIKSLSQVIIKKENPSNGKIIRYDKPKVEPIVEKEKAAEKIVPNFAPATTKREMSDALKYRLSLSRYLRPIVEMENINPNKFPFDQNMKSGIITISCQDEENAILIERSIAHISKELVMRDGRLLMVDGSKFYRIEKKPFAFPPKEGQSPEIVKEKIQKVSLSSVSVSLNGKRFFVSFKRESSAKKAHKILKDLGWDLVDVHSDSKSIIVKCGYAERKEPTAPSLPATSVPVPFALAPLVKPVPSPNKSMIPSSDEEILEELKSLLATGNLSPETTEKIQKAIMDEIKKSDEEYAKTLLAKLGY